MMKDLLMTVPCHRDPKRCLHIKGKPMPICARCFAMLLGYIFVPIAVLPSITVSIWIPILMAIPLMIDGFTQRWKWRKSSNPIHLITGLFFGVGQSLFISTIVWTLVKWIE
ncbi:MAG TPA: DUF2085 domain-containing protein [Bacillales bacterium]|nr:DUF2085 domain-containing protein [Bacillales bacterium]